MTASGKQGMSPITKALFGMLVVLIVGGIASIVVIGNVTFKADLWAALWPRLQLMFVVAVVIERAVETYLYATGQNGPDRFVGPLSSDQEQPPATRAAVLCALVLGVLVSLVGVRILEAIVTGTMGTFHAFLWAGVDVVISAGLLAGGSALIHEIMELLRGSLNVGSRALGGGGWKHQKSLPATSAVPSDEKDAEYQISIKRTGTDSGTLKFNEGGVLVDSTCWWDPDVKVLAGTYTQCSATRMSTKTDSVTGLKRPGIFLPTAVAPDTGNNTIFIHEGKDASWSDGCIVLNRDDMMRMWNAIEKDSQNVTVQIAC
ncbi:MAG: hypothetical protein ABJ308_09755 [Halieaceae bacterium]